MLRRKYLRPDKILAVLHNIEGHVPEYDSSGFESEANDSRSECNALFYIGLS